MKNEVKHILLKTNLVISASTQVKLTAMFWGREQEDEIETIRCKEEERIW